MAKYALIGNPLAQSMSHILHRKLFALNGRYNEKYDLLEIAHNDFHAKFEHLSSYDGFNVTIPYKETVYKKLKKTDENCKIIEAVNTVAKDRDGCFKGYNTDIFGFNRSMQDEGYKLKGKILLLGCGATAKMIAMQAIKKGAYVYIAVRESSQDKAKLFKKRLIENFGGAKVEIIDIKNIPKEKFDILINATPCGMYPGYNDMPVDELVLDRVESVFDVIYNPTCTKLIKKALSRKLKARGGVNMFVYQAVQAHKIWYGAEFKREEIEKIIKDVSKIIVDGR